MAASARKYKTAQPAPGLTFPPPPAAELVTNAALHAPLRSPTHAIQDRLRDALDKDSFAPPAVEKWPLNKALLFMVGASLLLWGAIGAAIFLAVS